MVETRSLPSLSLRQRVHNRCNPMWLLKPQGSKFYGEQDLGFS